MRVLIIDDEKNSSELTSNLLRNYCPQVQILGIASSVHEGFEAVMKLQPDLIFLDIQMQDGTGFDMLNRFTQIDFKIIFITAYQQYAIDALRRSAIDYLLKPLSPPDLVNAVARAEQLHHTGELKVQLRTLLENISEPKLVKQKLILKTMDRIFSLNVNEIVRFHSEGSYTEVFTRDGKKIVVSRLIKEFDEMLSSCGFLRVHQSHLINIDYIFCFEKTESQLILKDESVIPVSVRKRDDLLSLLNSL